MDKSNIEAPAILGEDRDLLSILYNFKMMRENYEPMGYLSRRAYEGKHFVYWSREQQKIQEIPIKKQFFNQMPEVSKQTDAMENFIIATQFVFTVVPKLLSETSSVRDSMYLSLLAREYYKKFADSTVAADFVHNSLLDNVGFVETYGDVVNKTVGYRAFDMYDILYNPMVHNWDEQTIVAKVVRRKIPELRASKLYHVPEGYSPISGSEFLTWKDVYQQEKYSQFADLAPDETLLFECFIMDPEEGLTIKALDGAGTVMRNDHYPKIKMCPIQPLRMYSGEWMQPSYVYREIPINRSIDTLSSRFDDIILRLARGGWIIQEEEDIDGGMTEETGQEIRYSSVKPEQMQMGTVPSFFPEWFSMLLSLSERYGMSSIFSGGLPNKASGLRANKMIESLKGMTTQNNTTFINNYRAAVMNVLRLTFMFLYEMWDTPQDILSNELGEQSDQAPKFISDKNKDLFNDQDVIGIPNEFKRFDVEVDNGMGYTLDERKKTALELNKIQDSNGKPLLSSDALRKIFKLGASGYLMEADEPSMADTKEFQKLIANFDNLTPDQKKAVITTLQTVGQQTGNTPSNPAQQAKFGLNPGGGTPQGGQSQAPTPAPTAPPAAAPKPQPAQPQPGAVPPQTGGVA
jgi:hypothetical protein